MAVRASVTDVSRNFADFVNRVAFRGERFLLMRGGRAVAELSPVPEGRTLGELTSVLAALPHLTPTEASAFARDLDAVREATLPISLDGKWGS
jgi:antitoxin (DNA-binding transcriptional repressor) of toxin-antitoxin stability system